jgi:hypothetical protein
MAASVPCLFPSHNYTQHPPPFLRACTDLYATQDCEESDEESYDYVYQGIENDLVSTTEVCGLAMTC